VFVLCLVITFIGVSRWRNSWR